MPAGEVKMVLHYVEFKLTLTCISFSAIKSYTNCFAYCKKLDHHHQMLTTEATKAFCKCTLILCSRNSCRYSDRIQARWTRNQDSIPNRGKQPDWLQSPCSPITNEYMEHFPQVLSGQGMKLTIPPLPICPDAMVFN
jgi:hypothetical protein